MFGNAPRALWEKWAAPDELNRIELACRALLASPLEGKTVLFETGIGAFFDPRMRERYGVQESQHVLIDSLREAGFEHEDIDVVVLSHLHFDHAGGLLAAWSEGREPELLFPNATYVVGAQHWQRAVQPHPRDRASFIPELPGLLQASGRLEVVDGMHARKARMAELADAFIALPGGLGTLEELFEVWTWGQLGYHAKPLGLLDVDGFYARLTDFLDHLVAERFVREQHRDILQVGESPSELLARIHANHASLLDGIRTKKALTPELEAELKDILAAFAKTFA